MTVLMSSPDCQEGRALKPLTPPPVLPPPSLLSPSPSNQVTSLPVFLSSAVPPTERTKGLLAGKSSWAWSFCTWSSVPSSPLEIQTVMPALARAFKVSLISSIASWVQMSVPSARP